MRTATAWEISVLDESDPLVQLMQIGDPVLRLKTMVSKKLTVPSDRAAVVIGEGVAAAKPHLRRGLALATYLAIRERSDIPASTVELLATEILPAIEPVERKLSIPTWATEVTRTMGARVADVNGRCGADSDFARYHANLLNSFLPDGLPDKRAVISASEEFEQLWKEFSLQ